MKVFDVNPKHNLALVEIEPNKPEYVQLDQLEAAEYVKDEPYAYLTQRHYVARSTAKGAVITQSAALLDGWKNMESNWIHGADLKHPSLSKPK